MVVNLFTSSLHIKNGVSVHCRSAQPMPVRNQHGTYSYFLKNCYKCRFFLLSCDAHAPPRKSVPLRGRHSQVLFLACSAQPRDCFLEASLLAAYSQGFGKTRWIVFRGDGDELLYFTVRDSGFSQRVNEHR